ncbi:MAG: hypothetical protein KGL39_14845 [Patescibacteria group bacterium]|nr:hypothetical protein [Patescibacteria group bacterium]
MKQHTTRHHRKPQSKNGSNEPRNLSFVGENAHRAWHYLFQNFDPPTIAAIINRTWLDPDYVFVVKRREP